MPEPIEGQEPENAGGAGGEGGEGGAGSGEGSHPEGGGTGGGGDATPKVKIGDKEYTPEELAKAVEKSGSYDSLLPEYTKATQRLADIDKAGGGKGQEDGAAELPPWAKEGWKPTTFEELQKAIIWARDNGRSEALKTLEERETKANELKAEVEGFFSEVKKENKDFDDQDFSTFVLDHTKGKEDVNLADLKMLYSVYKELDRAAEIGEARAAGNRGARTEKVNTAGNEGSAKGPDFTDIRAGGGNIRDVAHIAFERAKGT